MTFPTKIRLIDEIHEMICMGEISSEEGELLFQETERMTLQNKVSHILQLEPGQKIPVPDD